MAPRDIHPSNNFVNATDVVEPQGYPHAVTINGAGRMIYTSGQFGNYADGSFPGTFGDQAKLAVENLLKVLRAAGSSSKDIVKLIFYVVDWDENLYAELVSSLSLIAGVGGNQLLRSLTTLVPVAKLAVPQAKFEIEAVAAIGGLQMPFELVGNAANFEHLLTEVDVVVVGGGFSGCMAAYDVQQAGYTVALLEAKHRIGGRSRTQKLESGPGLIELGATWINQFTQPTVYELTKRFGLTCKEQFISGDIVWELEDGVVVQSPGALPEIPDPEVTGKLNRLMEALEIASKEIDLRDFKSFSQEEDVTVSEWLSTKGLYDTSLLRGVARFLTTAWVGREPEECGIHYVLDYIKSAGGLASINVDGPGGAQELKVREGTSAIANSLAGALKPGSVQINAPVDSITQYQNRCIITTSSGARYKAKKAIIATPTNTYTNIHFSPPLPQGKKALVSRTKPGVYAKIILTYNSAWWKEAGLQGKFMSLKGPFSFSWDISDDTTNQYSLAVFVAGKFAVEWHKLGELGREEAVIEQLATMVGPELAGKARNVLEVTTVEWTKEDFIGGGPTSAIGPKLLRAYGSALREPFCSIHFAGGETAYEWKGYLEGAITSGKRAADEVVKALST